MAYSPTETEKKRALLLQALAVILFFIPPWIGIRSRMGRTSPFLRYWTKVNLIWSLLAVFLIAAAVAVEHCLDIGGVLVLVILLHVVLCVMGAFAASWSLPFGYLFVAACFCADEKLALEQPWSAVADTVDESE